MQLLKRKLKLINLEESTGRIDMANFVRTGPWTNEKLELYPVIDTVETPGPVNIPDEAKNPYDFFKLLFTEEMLESICNFTNSYAEQWKSSEESMSHDPLRPSTEMVNIRKMESSHCI
jgi:hypothetical protein